MPRLFRLSALAFLLLLVLLAALEGGLRLAGADLYRRTSILEYQEVYPPALHLDQRPDGLVIRRPRDPRIHWTAVPARKEAGTLRVVCFGASAVAGLSSASIYRKAKSDPTFPKLIRLGSRCTRIRALDLSAWIAAQAAKAEEVQVGNQPGAIGR